MSAETKELNLLKGLSRRLQGDPAYMAYVLAMYKKQEGLDDEDLATYLNSFPEFVLRLELCKRPEADALDFAEQVRSLSDFTLIDETVLAHIIRQVDSLALLANNPTMAEKETSAACNQLSGALAAARDRDEVPPTYGDTDKTDEENV
jgi:hypothetical protein